MIGTNIEHTEEKEKFGWTRTKWETCKVPTGGDNSEIRRTIQKNNNNHVDDFERSGN